MYLDFIKDIFKPNDVVTLRTTNGGSVTGAIIKLTSDLIALKTSDGRIVITKDSDITDVSSSALPSSTLMKTEQKEEIHEHEEEKPQTPVITPKVTKNKDEELPPTLGEKVTCTTSQKDLLASVSKLIVYLPSSDSNTIVPCNAYIVDVDKETFYVSTNSSAKLKVSYSTIVESSLYAKIKGFTKGDVIPLIIYTNPDNSSEILLTLSLSTIGDIAYLLLSTVKEQHLEQTKKICLFLHSLNIKYVTKGNLDNILSQLVSVKISTKVNKAVESDSIKEQDEKIHSFKEIDSQINTLLRQGKHTEAINVINKALKGPISDQKTKSSMLLKKAQTYSSLRDYKNAMESYSELIKFNESIHSDSRNLSHLYTELARLQAMDNTKKDEAIKSVEKALYYNNKNTFASTLHNQLLNESTAINNEIIDEDNDDDQDLILDFEDSPATISKMIDIDIKEHKYTNEDILRNDGKPTSIIAKHIFDEAKATRNTDLSERYPVYLEAAKAFSELPVGSYDSQEYLEAVAYYAILKGDSLFINFRNAITQGERNINNLTLLKDSACSYYIESLNLMSNISPQRLLSLLSNYLKLNIALCDLRNNKVINFSGQFNRVFFDCLASDNSEYNEIALLVVIAVGSASVGAWNKLFRVKGRGTRGLYSVISKNRKIIYNMINKLLASNINTDLQPGAFLKEAFQYRRERNKNFASICNEILKLNLDVHTILSLSEKWKDIDGYVDLLSSTDLESKKVVEDILKILLPYTKRNQAERTNLLIQVQRLLERQIKFINSNTTYYGRTFFFPLLSKWNINIQSILDKKIADTLPDLQILVDPPYIVADGEKRIVNLMIKNTGESTAEGCVMLPSVKSITDKNFIKAKQEYNNEIPAGSILEVPLNLPSALCNANIINLEMGISAYYQGKETPIRNFSFTIEKEPASSLNREEIPWKDGPIPDEQMFKGRHEILDILTRHYTTAERDKPYILYGLTRTGKSSILRYLKNALDKKSMLMRNETLTIATFEWDFSQAASFGNASDLWQYLLFDQIYENLDKYLGRQVYSDFKLSEKPRAKDLSSILQYLKKKGLYPLFLVDEFSFIKVLMDNKIINTAFLHTLRQHSLEGLASFVYAGTYDIKTLIKDQKYGITGQLVNAVEKQINEIDKKSAEELMNVMGDKLRFTKEAINHIHKLSGDVPYFIQIICKYCGYYAVEKKRSIIGYPELEQVIKVLTGEREGEQGSMVMPLPENTFQNNMYSPSDPREVNVLITSLTYFNRGNENQRGVGIVELQELWAKKNIQAFRAMLAESIELLIEKKVLVQYQDDDIPVYKLSVDLFRRWWGNHHEDLAREIDTLYNR